MASGIFRSPAVVLVAAGVLAIAFVAGGAQFLSPAAIVAQEESYTAHGWRGVLKLAGGTDGRGEEYVTSWKAGEKSELIVAKGRVEKAAFLQNDVCRYQYRVFVNGAEQSQWHSPVREAPRAITFNFIDLEAHTFAVIGALTGEVRVELWLETDPIGACKGETKEFAQDGARLVSGRGRIQVEGGSDKFEEGDTIRFGVDTGHGKWRVTLYDGLGNARCGLVAGFSLATADRLVQDRTSCKTSLEWDNSKVKSRQGTLTYTVPKGVFRSDGQNKWRIVLENTVIAQSSDEFITLDQKDLAPEVPLLGISNERPTVDEVVRITFSARANPSSKSPITNFVLTAWYGSYNLPPSKGDPSYIVDSVSVQATPEGDRYVGEYSFRVREPSVIKYRGYAVDAAGRISGSQLSQADVKALEDVGLTDPNDNARGEIRTQGSEGQSRGFQPPSGRTEPAAILLLLVGAAVAGVVSWVYLPFGRPVKYAALGLIGAVAWWFYSTLGAA